MSTEEKNKATFREYQKALVSPEELAMVEQGLGVYE